MTTDPFTEAELSDYARAEAETRWPQRRTGHYVQQLAFMAGAEWARTHLAAQEPDTAGPHGLDESAPIRNLGYYRSSARCKCGHEVIWGEHDGDAGLDEAWRVHIMRSAVYAVRATRRDEEKR